MLLRGSAVEISFRRQLVYRAATMAGMVTNLFWGFLRAYVFQAVAAATDSGTVAGYNTEQLFTYSALTQALLSMLLVFGWWDLMQAVKTGDIVTDLCRPVNLFWFWQARDTGRCLHDLLLRSIPLFVIAAWLMPLVLPDSWEAWIAFAASLALAYLISFSWRFTVNCIAFWSLDARGFCSIGYMIAMLLMGFVIPVGWFPPWLQHLAAWTPFPAMLNVPTDIFLGRIPLAAVPYALLRQLGWLIVMTALAQTMLKLGARKLVIQGG